MCDFSNRPMRLEIGQCTTSVTSEVSSICLNGQGVARRASLTFIFLEKSRQTCFFGTEPFVHEGKMDFSVPAEKVNAI